MNTQCLEMYLNRLKKMLCCGCLPQERGIDVLCMEFGYIIESLASIRVVDVNKSVRRPEGVDILEVIYF